MYDFILSLFWIMLTVYNLYKFDSGYREVLRAAVSVDEHDLREVFHQTVLCRCVGGGLQHGGCVEESGHREQ